MKHVNLMAQLTFRDALMRIALVLSVVTLIVWFMPRETHHNFKVESS